MKTKGKNSVTTKPITIEKKLSLPGGVEKTVTKSGTAVVAQTQEDVLTLLSEDSSAAIPNDASDAEKERIRNRTIKAVNYAFDLWTRAKLTQQLNSENVDPGKANDKAFTDFNKARVANGKAELTREAFDALMAA